MEVLTWKNWVPSSMPYLDVQQQLHKVNRLSLRDNMVRRWSFEDSKIRHNWVLNSSAGKKWINDCCSVLNLCPWNDVESWRWTMCRGLTRGIPWPQERTSKNLPCARNLPNFKLHYMGRFLYRRIDRRHENVWHENRVFQKSTTITWERFAA
jgi:hypothetical protein